MFRVALAVGLVVVGLLGAALALGWAEGGGGGGGGGGLGAGGRADLVFVDLGDASTLDPQQMTWLDDLRLGRLLFEPLVQNDVLSEGFEIIPAAAERWEVSSDGREYRFTLSERGRWSNGEPVRASDFVYSFRRGLLPDVGSKWLPFYTLIEGGRRFYDWRRGALEDLAAGRGPYADGLELWGATEGAFGSMVSIRAEGELVLWLRLERAVPYFLELLAEATMAPVYGPLVGAYERPDRRTGRLGVNGGWTRAGVLVGNGPYRLVSRRFKRDMRLEASPHHRGYGGLSIRTIEVQAIEDPGAAVLALRSGAVDWLPEVTAGYRAEMLERKLGFYREHAGAVGALEAEGHDPFTVDRLLPADPRAWVHVTPAAGTYFYNFNCRAFLSDGRRNPFADARVRRAFAMTVDKRAIADGVRRIGERAAGSLTPPGLMRGYTPPAGLVDVGSAADGAERGRIIAAARGLLTEAGYADPARDFPIEVEIMFNKDAGHDLIAAVLAKGWEGALGVRTRLVQKETKVFLDDRASQNYVVSRGSWYADYPDPMTFLESSRSGDANNDRGYESAVYDGMLERAESASTLEERLALLAEAEGYVVEEEAVVVPIFHYNDMQMFNPHRLTGVSAHPRSKQNVWLFDVLGDGVGGEEPRPMRPGRGGEGEPEGEGGGERWGG